MQSGAPIAKYGRDEQMIYALKINILVAAVVFGFAGMFMLTLFVWTEAKQYLLGLKVMRRIADSLRDSIAISRKHSRDRERHSSLIERGIQILFLGFVTLSTTSVAWAGQLEPKPTAVELQQRGDLVGAEKELQNAVRDARVAGTRSVNLARALVDLGIFYQDIGRFTQAESSFVTALEIFKRVTRPDDPALAPLIIHLTWLYVET